MSLLDRARQRLEPAFGLPLQCVFAPDSLVRVGGRDVGKNHGALHDGNLCHHRAVDAADRLGKREDRVLFRPGMSSSKSVYIYPKRNAFTTYCLNEILAGA